MLRAGRILAIAMLASATMGAHVTAAGAVDTNDDADLRAGLEADLASNPTIPGEILAVRAPGVRSTVAAGVADTTAGTPLRPDTPFRIASVTKTFVAAAVLRLVEQGKLRLDDPIAEHLSRQSLDVLRADGYDVDHITVRQLLQHTAGLYDYAADAAYLAKNAGDPSHRWTRVEQLRFATEHGDPLGPPGAQYHYSDTAYVLLGEILERTTGGSLPAAVRRLVRFDRLGLDHTYWDTLEPTPKSAKPRAHQYVGTFDNIGLDASTDLYGGGGLVSTVGDVATFYRALFHDEVFAKPSTLRTMVAVPPVTRAAGEGAGMGIYDDADVAGLRCFAHRGYYGTQAIYCPDADLTLVRTTNQAVRGDFDSNALEASIVAAIK